MIRKLIDYYAALAAENRHIGTFVRMNANEFLNMDGEGAVVYPCMAVETVTGIISGSQYDNPNTAITGGFAILNAVPPGDYARETEVLQRTFDIGMQILARINRDRENGTNPELLYFDIDNVSWEILGPMGNNAYGTLFKVKTFHPINLDVDPGDWQNG